MPRELTPEIEEVVNSPSFEFYDYLEFTLPFKDGETSPVTVKVATGEITVATNEDFEQFTFRAFLSAYGRLPFAAEQSAWTAALETAFNSGPAAFLAEVKDRLRDLFESTAYTDRDRTDWEYVKDLYGAYLGRNPDFSGQQFWINEVAAVGRAAVLTAFEVDTGEFAPKVALINQPQEFAALLEHQSAISIGEGRAIDNADFNLFNPDNQYSSVLTEADRILYPAAASVGRAFRVGEDTYQADEIMPGTVRFNQVAKDIGLTVVSDMSRKGATVALPVTQRCSHIYKGPGCDTNDPSPTCSRIFDDATNGCASKDPAPVLIDATNNQPSFGGVPRDAGAETPTQPPGTTDGGFDGGFIDPREGAILRGSVGSVDIRLADVN